MRQTELYRAVARATGESVSIVKRLGFLLAEGGGDFTKESDPRVIDWDELESRRFNDSLPEPCDDPLFS
ncbi:MAG: hypothetical protein KDB14_26170 [Planctomycetales bacterium]|nr:hypothetical protein [Planctomycetales bacterium]